MKRIRTENRNHLLLFFAIIFFLCLFGCNGINHTEPIIHFFTADTFTITEGDSITLNWEVTEATAVTIEPNIGLIDLSGSLLVSPVITTTYILTATNSCGQIFSPVSITDTVTIQVNPAITE